jgi:hypothetical protein
MLTANDVRAIPLFSTFSEATSGVLRRPLPACTWEPENSPCMKVGNVGEGSMAIAFVHQYLQNEGRSQRSRI